MAVRLLRKKVVFITGSAGFILLVAAGSVLILLSLASDKTGQFIVFRSSGSPVILYQ